MSIGRIGFYFHFFRIRYMLMLTQMLNWCDLVIYSVSNKLRCFKLRYISKQYCHQNPFLFFHSFPIVVAAAVLYLFLHLVYSIHYNSIGNFFFLVESKTKNFSHQKWSSFIVLAYLEYIKKRILHITIEAWSSQCSYNADDPFFNSKRNDFFQS